MNKENTDKKNFLKNWIIKKFLLNNSTKEDILELITSENFDNQEIEDKDENNEKNLIKNILILNEKSVEDVMVHRGEIISVEKNQNYNEILSIIKNESHSRMPVFEQNLDNALGFFHIKDFLKIDENNFDINSILRDVLFVAPQSPILELLKRMRLSRIHMGLVVDEFGGVDGLVTIEDLVEEIVGEIEDEHDIGDIINKKISETEYLFSSRMEVDQINSKYSLELPESEEYETIAGLFLSLHEDIPAKGESIEYENKILFIDSVDEKSIKLIRIVVK